MQLHSLHFYAAEIPLRMRFAHARAARDRTRNVVACARLTDGTAGLGEGVPREYVTGETPALVKDVLLGADLASLGAKFRTFEEVVDALREWELPSDGDHVYHAARCAVELAVLDAFARHFGRPLSDVAPIILEPGLLNARPRAVHYSMVIPAGSARKRALLARLARLAGFRSIKVKVGDDVDADVDALMRVRHAVGPTVDLRIDANGAWSLDEARQALERMRPSGLSAVEEPVRPADVGRLSELRSAGCVPVILDESFVSADDAERAAREHLCDIVDIRISKCGGITKSLELVALANRLGLDFMLGCQVGESAILGAAGRHLACTVKGWRYLEGSYDRLLLKRNLARPAMNFGLGGAAGPLDASGLGVRRIRWRPDHIEDWGERTLR